MLLKTVENKMKQAASVMNEQELNIVVNNCVEITAKEGSIEKAAPHLVQFLDSNIQYKSGLISIKLGQECTSNIQNLINNEDNKEFVENYNKFINEVNHGSNINWFEMQQNLEIYNTEIKDRLEKQNKQVEQDKFINNELDISKIEKNDISIDDNIIKELDEILEGNNVDVKSTMIEEGLKTIDTITNTTQPTKKMKDKLSNNHQRDKTPERQSYSSIQGIKEIQDDLSKYVPIEGQPNTNIPQSTQKKTIKR